MNDMINQLGDNFESIRTSYFEEFKKSIKAIFRIPKSLVETHAKDICFLVDTNYTYAQVVVPRVRWLKDLPYEVKIDETSAAIIALFSKEVDKNAQNFGTYEETKERITTNLQITKVVRKNFKKIKNFIEQFGEEGEEEEYGKEKKSQGPLLLTQGQNEEEEQQERKGKGLVVAKLEKKTKTTTKRQRVIESTPQKVQGPLELE